MTSSVMSVARRLAANAVSAMKRALNSNSPSKVTGEIGEDFDLGFIIGIKKYAQKAANTVKDMARNTSDELQANLQNALPKNTANSIHAPP